MSLTEVNSSEKTQIAILHALLDSFVRIVHQSPRAGSVIEITFVRKPWSAIARRTNLVGLQNQLQYNGAG